MWVSQILAVMRLEWKKTFFARRGLGIYALAVLPVLLFAGHTLAARRAVAQVRARATIRPEQRPEVVPGMARADVIAKLGQPYSRETRSRRNFTRETLWYSDGEVNFRVDLKDDVVTSTGVNRGDTLAEDWQIFAAVYQFFFLRFAIFFGCVAVFMNLFRGEMLDRSLHFYLLAPLRREVLVVAKYCAGLLATCVIFTASVALQLLAVFALYDGATTSRLLNEGGGWGQVLAYLAITPLACAGYGSVFLLAGLLFKNPIIPAASILLWEGLNWFLPSVLKKISIIFYLQSLCPVPTNPLGDIAAPLRLLASTASPTPAPLAITGLLVVAAVVVALAARRARSLEINYSSD
jgi:ABC-type transport system involved in multi-copper enzyme maturation permease subunit